MIRTISIPIMIIFCTILVYNLFPCIYLQYQTAGNNLGFDVDMLLMNGIIKYIFQKKIPITFNHLLLTCKYNIKIVNSARQFKYSFDTLVISIMKWH